MDLLEIVYYHCESMRLSGFLEQFAGTQLLFGLNYDSAEYVLITYVCHRFADFERSITLRIFGRGWFSAKKTTNEA